MPLSEMTEQQLLEWARAALPLVAELGRHVVGLHPDGAYLSLPAETESDLCAQLQRLADQARPPFDPAQPIFTCFAVNDLSDAEDKQTGFHSLVLDAGAQVVRPHRAAGYLDEGAWQVDFQLKDGVTLEFWLSELRSLWQHAHDGTEMDIEMYHGEVRLFRAALLELGTVVTV